MRKRALGTLSIAVVAAGMTLAMGPAQPVKASATPATYYYLSLGDSLSQGFQPTTAHPGGQVTNNGYADQLYSSIKGRWGTHPLALQKLGCPGETTESMINGSAVPADDNYGPSYCSAQYSSNFGVSDQLHAALTWIQAVGASNVKVITIDIGANDAQGTQTGNNGPECDANNGHPNGVVDFTPLKNGQPPTEYTPCLLNGVNVVATNLPTIMNALRAAAPNALIRGMSYYDPFLWVAAVANHDFGSGTPCGQPCVDFAMTTVNQTNAFNHQALLPAFKAVNAPMIDVYNTFQTGNWTPDAVSGVPINVEIICSWTFMCDPTFGPNIHATTQGYSAIAGAFAQRIRPDHA